MDQDCFNCIENPAKVSLWLRTIEHVLEVLFVKAQKIQKEI